MMNPRQIKHPWGEGQMEAQMNNHNLTQKILLLLVIGLALSACRVTILEADDTQETQEVIGLANPAALYCEGMGYTLESVERDGGMDADCVFPDGERCPQWDFLAGRCNQERSFCEVQGGQIQADGSVGNCLFSDGSTCNELQFYNGECSVGDNPAQDSEEEAESVEAEDTETEVIEIKDFVSARDYLVAYLSEEYGFEPSESWMETNITSQDAAAVNTYRYVAGPLTIVLSAEASAPYASIYNAQEVTDMSNGFYWTGTIAFDGTISEIEVSLPFIILDREDAREAALEYLSAAYEISYPTSWIDEGMSQSGEYKTAQRYSAGSWLVTVENEPSAPFVSSYTVTVENSSLGLLWEGEITGQGQITQISFVQ
jgi:putative hemolysin